MVEFHPGASTLSIADGKFRYEQKGGKEKKIKLAKISGVKPVDARAPDVLKFSTASKSYKFVFEDVDRRRANSSTCVTREVEDKRARPQKATKDNASSTTLDKGRETAHRDTVTETRRP